MNNQLPEHNWKIKLYSYSSPVDKSLFGKILDAKNKKGDQPISFWLILSALLIFISGSMLFIEKRTADINSIKHVPVPLEGLRHEQNKAITRLTPTAPAPGKFEDNQRENVEHEIDKQSFASGAKRTGASTTAEAGITAGGIKNQSGENTVQENQLTRNLTYTPYYPVSVYGKSWEKKQHLAGLLADFTAVPASFSLPPLFSPLEGKLDPGVKNELQKFVFPDCPDFGDRRNDWYLEVFGALDFPHKKMVDVVGKSDYLAKKDSSEKFLLSYSAGFRISRNISQSWLLKTGLHLSQFNESFQYRNERERRITTVITIRTIVRAPGDTLYISDSSQVEVTGVRVKTTNNSYRNIDIPLLLSYELRSPGFTIGFQGGTIFNLRSTFHGDMLDTTGFPMSESGKNTASQFNNSLGFGVYASASLIKSVTADFDIFAEPYYRRYINNQASAAAPFEQYLSNWGLQFGIRYKMNKSGQHY